MPPKFQSSFIPKGSFASSAPVPSSIPSMRRAGNANFLSSLGFFIFTFSIVLAIGVFGYKFYLQYSIDRMGDDIEQARAALDPSTINELTSLNDRIVAAKNLILSHQVITPLLAFLEESTPVSVRFTSFQYEKTDRGLELRLDGEARGYSALALQAEIFNDSRYFKNQAFSNLTLNQRGDVEFSFNGVVSPELVAYYAKSVPVEPTIEEELLELAEPEVIEESNLPQ